MSRLPIYAAALASLLVGTIASAVAAQAQGAGATEWKLYETRDSCSIGGKPGRAFVFLVITPEGEQGLRIHHPSIAIGDGEVRRAVLTIGDTRLGLEVRGARTSDGTPGFTLLGRRDLRSALAASSAATLEVLPGAPLALDLTGLAEALPRLDRCADQLAPRDPDSIVAVAPRITRMPSINPSQLLLDTATKPAMGYRLTISREGRAESCEITQSSGSGRLDSTICQMLTAGTRFTPARNAANLPVVGTYQSKVSF